MAKGNDSDRYVVPNKERGGWDVVREGHKRASAHKSTQRQAISRAKEITRNLGGGEVRVQGENRKFRAADIVKGPKQKESRAPDRRGRAGKGK
ncbi:MAG TPA: DUF2188 domain-containing protein [Solirubrobacteraceae bacterium]